MVPLNDPRMLEEYLSASLGPDDYSWLESEVPTIAVKAVLVGFDFSSRRTPYYERRCDELKTLGDVIRANMDSLRENGHPKWNEVNLDAEIGLWKRDQCAYVKPTPAVQQQSEQRDFLNQELEKCIRTGSCD